MIYKSLANGMGKCAKCFKPIKKGKEQIVFTAGTGRYSQAIRVCIKCMKKILKEKIK